MGRRVAMVMALGLSLIDPIRAPAAADAGLADRDQAAIRTTIESQLAAFRRDDGAAAFSYAAPSIQEKFDTPENFMAMVRIGYEPVYRPREVEFHEIAVLEGAPTQEVLLVDRNGIAVSCLLPDAAAAGRAMADQWLCPTAHRRSGDVGRAARAALPLGAQDLRAARHFRIWPSGEEPSAT